MTEEQLPARGRPVVLQPNPPGLWSVLLGVGVAGLSPLFGFLIGSILGNDESPTGNDPIFLGLTLGLVVGAVGLAWAISGVFRLWRSRRSSQADSGPATGLDAEPAPRTAAE